MSDSTTESLVTVPAAAVAALDQLEQTWPGATQPQARAVIAAEVMTALELRTEYAIVDHHQAGNVAEAGFEDADETVEAMARYPMAAWMAGSRLVSDWRNLEST